MVTRRKTIPKGRTVEFEEEPTIEGGSVFDYLSVWYGPPKIGKSTLLSKFDGAYFLCTEPGFKHLKIRKSRIENWADFTTFVRWAVKNKSKVKTVKMWVIDPVDKLAKYCMDYICMKRGIDHPSDQEWGKGWEAFRDEFTKYFLTLCSIGPGVAVISHVKEREIMTPRGIELTTETPAMPKTAYTVVNDLADVIIKVGYSPKNKRGENKRCLFCRGTQTFEAGDRTDKLPPRIIFDTEEEAVNLLNACFSGRKEKKKKSKKLRKRA